MAKQNKTLSGTFNFKAAVIAAVVLAVCSVSLLNASEEKSKDPNNQPAVVIKEANEPNKPNVLKDPNDPNNWPFVEIWVVDKQTDEPIKGAEVKGSASKKEVITDNDGYCKVTLGKNKTNYFRVFVQKSGFVPLYMSWNEGGIWPIPQEFTFSVDRGSVIGGIVKNDSNEPVKDANVVLSLYSQSYNNGNDAPEPRVQINDYVVHTDSDGQWLCDIIPAELLEDHQIGIRVQHAGYAMGECWAHTYDDSKIRQLRDKNFVVTISKGLTIYGYVRSGQNNPIAKASVLLGESLYHSDKQKIKTDATGYYEFQNVKRGFNTVTVQAKGYAGATNDLNINDQSQQVDIVMLKGTPIVGYVVDVNGNPIEKAELRISDWQGRQLLNWTMKTDVNGKFSHHHVPAGELKFNVYKKNYMSQTLIINAEQQQEYKVILTPPLIVSGNIIDADTNQPITNCKITTGTVWRNGEQVCWQRSSGWTKTFAAGKYEMQPYGGAVSFVFRVDANDGRFAISRNFEPNEGNVKYDFIIGGKQQNLLAGTVYLPDGNTADGAKVYMVKKDRWGQFTNGKAPYWDEELDKATADAQGKFTLPDCNEAFKLVAMCDGGFADVNSAEFLQKPEIHLQEWGRIEGVVYIGSKLAAGQEVSANVSEKHNNRDNINYQYSNKATSDPNGKFVMEKVVPGQNHIYRLIMDSDNMRSTSAVGQTVEVLPGQTAEVVLGGKGRTIVGEIIWPSEDFYKKMLEIHAQLQTQRSENTRELMMKIYSKMQVPVPADFDYLTAKQAVVWYKNFMQSDEGKAWQAKVQEELQKESGNEAVARTTSSSGVIVDSDGSFRAEDVEAGSYMMNVNVMERKGRYGQADYQNPLLTGTFDFNMPAIDETNLDLPLDLGQVTLNAASLQSPQLAGSDAPEFTLETNAGTVKSADLLGKYVVLVWWECFSVLSDDKAEANFGSILDAYQKYGNTGNVEFIGLSFKSIKITQDIAEKYLREKQCKWKQAFTSFDNPIIARFKAANNGQAIIVISQDGKIVASAKSGSELAEILAEKLTPAQ